MDSIRQNTLLALIQELRSSAQILQAQTERVADILEQEGAGNGCRRQEESNCNSNRNSIPSSCVFGPRTKCSNRTQDESRRRCSTPPPSLSPCDNHSPIITSPCQPSSGCNNSNCTNQCCKAKLKSKSQNTCCSTITGSGRCTTGDSSSPSSCMTPTTTTTDQSRKCRRNKSKSRSRVRKEIPPLTPIHSLLHECFLLDETSTNTTSSCPCSSHFSPQAGPSTLEDCSDRSTVEEVGFCFDDNTTTSNSNNSESQSGGFSCSLGDHHQESIFCNRKDLIEALTDWYLHIQKWVDFLVANDRNGDISYRGNRNHEYAISLEKQFQMTLQIICREWHNLIVTRSSS